MLNIAQIGVGYWGPNLLRNLMANKSCTVRAVADLDAGRRDYVRRLYPAVRVTDRPRDVFENKSARTRRHYPWRSVTTSSSVPGPSSPGISVSPGSMPEILHDSCGNFKPGIS
jgi:hypothetical protein